MRPIPLLAGLLFTVAASAGIPAPCTVETVAGGGETPIADGVPALEVKLGVPRGLTISPNGRLLFTDASAWKVLEVDADGMLRVLAGGDVGELRMNGIPAATARIAEPVDVAVGPTGEVLIVERIGNQVRRIDSDGLIQAFAGSGEFSCNQLPGLGTCGDGGLPVEAQTPLPRRIGVDPDGVVHILHDFTGSNVLTGPWLRRVHPDGRVDTLPFHLSGAELKESIVAFAFGPGDELIAHSSFPGADFYWLSPEGVATAIPDAEGLLVNASLGALSVGPDGSVYHAGGTGAIHRIAPDGRLSRITARWSGFSGDGGPAFDAQFNGISDMAFDAVGNLYVVDSGNARVRRISSVSDCPAPLRPWIAFTGTVEAASYAYSLAPGALFAVFGRNVGPAALTAATLDVQGRFPTELAGTRVLVNGVPAPLIFATADQVNAIVPWMTAAGETLGTEIVVERGGETSDIGYVTASPTAPGLFTADSSGDGQAAALNQDGSVNGPQNPAAPGEIVVFYGTGGGLTTATPIDGAAAEGPAELLAEVEVRIGFQPAQVLYAGAAPGLVHGVIQLNVLMDPELPVSAATPVDLWIGGVQSPGAPTVAVGPDGQP